MDGSEDDIISKDDIFDDGDEQDDIDDMENELYGEGDKLIEIENLIKSEDE